MSVLSKPMAPTAYDNERWQESGLRRRMLQGIWRNDLEDALLRHLPSDRREAWGPCDMSSNPLEQITRQLAVLYEEQPIVTNANSDDLGDLIGVDGYLTRAGLFPLMQRVQQMTLGIRETVLRIDVIPHVQGTMPRSAGINYRLVYPDFVYVETSPDSPDIPIKYQELRLRTIDGKPQWTWDLIDITDPDMPIFGMYLAEKNGELGSDISRQVMGHDTHKGESYPYVDKEGMPFLPIVIYRAEKTGSMWNSWDMSQIVSGTLNCGVLHSFYLHCVKSASWPQRYIAGLSLAGATAQDQDIPARRQTVTTDPTSVLVFTQDPDSTNPLIGQFQAGAEPEKLQESISSYEYRVATAGGISPAEASRTSGDPRSGYALAVSREGQREAQRRHAPVFRMSDLETLSKTASMCNRFLNTNLPEDGYRIQYHTKPLSSTEVKELREDVIAKLGAGLISPIGAMQLLYPDLDEDSARAKLLQIRRERAEFL
jgi:hypothetical protein